MFEGFKRGWYFDADGGGSSGAGGSGVADGGGAGAGGSGGSGGGDQGGQGGGGTPKPLVFDDWLKGQAEDVKTMLDGHTNGLKSALADERKTRGDLEKQLRELAGKAEKGSEAEKKLIEMADQMSENDRRAEFYEEAHKVGVANLKLAYLVAVQEELFDKKNRVNFEEMKKGYPELFGSTKPPKGNAGDGTNNNQPAGHGDMNTWIRRSAGRG
jgi:hypothetical protein